MESYTVSFKGMSGNDPDFIVTQAELDHLLNDGLVVLQAKKIRSAVLKELVRFHSPVAGSVPTVQDEQEAADGNH